MAWTTHGHEVAVVAMQSPVSGPLKELAERCEWQVLDEPSLGQVIRLIREGMRVLVVELNSGPAADAAVTLLERLSTYWIRVVLIAVIHEWSAALEKGLRTAGAMCYGADPGELEMISAVVRRCRPDDRSATRVLQSEGVCERR